MSRNSTFVTSLVVVVIGVGPSIASAASLPVSGNLSLWLDAGNGVTADVNGISAWTDQSGQSHGGSQPNNLYKPALVTNALNGNSVARFSGDGDHILLDAVNGGWAQTSESTGFFVFKTTSGGTQQLVARNGATPSYYFDNNRPALYPYSFTYPNAVSGFNVNREDYKFEGSAHIAVNGGGIQTVSSATTTLTNWTSIGDYQFGQFINGDMAEVVMYDRQLNTAEAQIVENHLSAKYALPMAANDHYAGDDNAQGDYDRGVLGIGRVDGSNQQLSSTTATGLSVSKASLSDDQWLLGGYKTVNNALTSDDVAEGSRMERVWYLDATNSLTGATTLTFNTVDAGLGSLSMDLGFALLFNPTDAFETSASNFSVLLDSGTATRVGDDVSFTIDGAQLGDGYYTLAVLVPEPGSLSLAGVAAAIGLISRRRNRR